MNIGGATTCAEVNASIFAIKTFTFPLVVTYTGETDQTICEYDGSATRFWQRKCFLREASKKIKSKVKVSQTPHFVYLIDNFHPNQCSPVTFER